MSECKTELNTEDTEEHEGNSISRLDILDKPPQSPLKFLKLVCTSVPLFNSVYEITWKLSSNG